MGKVIVRMEWDDWSGFQLLFRLLSQLHMFCKNMKNDILYGMKESGMCFQDLAFPVKLFLRDPAASSWHQAFVNGIVLPDNARICTTRECEVFRLKFFSSLWAERFQNNSLQYGA